jgi:hypothetical protein
MMMQPELASEISRLLKALDSGQSPKMKVVSVTYGHAVFLFFSTHDNLEMWKCRLWLGSEWSCSEKSGLVPSSSVPICDFKMTSHI